MNPKSLLLTIELYSASETHSLLKLPLWPEIVIKLHGGHSLSGPYYQTLLVISCIIAQQSPLKREFICILTTEVSALRTEQKQELLRQPWLGLDYQNISNSQASSIFPDTRHSSCPHIATSWSPLLSDRPGLQGEDGHGLPWAGPFRQTGINTHSLIHS